VARDRNEAINSYITDMLALEDHIEKAIKSQLADLKDYPDILTELRQIHRKIEHHISDLRMLSDRRNAGGVVESVKRAGAAVAGAAAGLIDLLRTEGLPKNLRDDYTAFNLASIGYLMLHTTALALDDQETADLAQQHLRDYAETIMRLNALVPAAVVRYLQREGLQAREGVVPQVNQTIEQIWRQTSESPEARESVSARQL
jgi:ferritin-like metal-binding protein YciE